MKTASWLVAATLVGGALAHAEDPKDPELAKWADLTVIQGSKDGQARVLPMRALNNCYNYAVNAQTNTFAQPGRKANGADWWAKYWGKLVNKNVFEGAKIPYKQPTDRKVKQRALEQYATIVRGLAEDDGLKWVAGPGLEKPNEIKVGADEHVVALVVGYIGATKKIDYHWYRRNKLPSGKYVWSHKMGPAAPSISAKDRTRLTDITKILWQGKANKDGKVNSSRTHYDLFVGYFKVKSTVQVNNGPDGETGRTGVVEVNDLSGGTYGWCLNDQSEVAHIAHAYLTDLPETVDPVWDDHLEYRGMHLYIAPGLLTGADCDQDGRLTILDFVCFQQLFQSGDLGADLNGDGVLNVLDFVAFKTLFDKGLVDPGLWEVGDAASIVAFDGVIRVITGFGEETTVAYYEDLFGLEQSLFDQLDERGEIHPVCD